MKKKKIFYKRQLQSGYILISFRICNDEIDSIYKLPNLYGTLLCITSI